MGNFRIACYAVVAFSAFAICACAPSATNKPDTAPASSGSSTQGSGNARAGEGQRDATRESSTQTPSSLDQLKEGKAPVTSASSPLKDIYFEFDRYDLRADARDTLKANADWLKNNPSTRVEIEGHCDPRGTNEYNLALGAKRSQTAKDYLVSLGIPGERISTISYGAEIPVCKDPTEDCWRQNRRARFVIVSGRPAS
jgi:peptidoglycan-associated lipoprotein